MPIVMERRMVGICLERRGLNTACFSFFIIFFNVYLVLRERKREYERGGAEREGDTESKADSGLRAVSRDPNVGLELMNHEIKT